MFIALIGTTVFATPVAAKDGLTPQDFVNAIVERTPVGSTPFGALVSTDDIELYDFFETCRSDELQISGQDGVALAVFDCSWQSRRFGVGVSMKLRDGQVYEIEIVMSGEIVPEDPR
jgi:hypothetical protein